jgi:hypothetical protein
MIFILIGLSTIWIFMFKIEWLFNYKTFLINIGYDIFLAALSLVLLSIQFGNPKMVVALQMPIISSVVFFVLHRIFKFFFKRDPENTFWVFTGKPIQDVLFSLLFWFIGAGVPFFILM